MTSYSIAKFELTEYDSGTKIISTTRGFLRAKGKGQRAKRNTWRPVGTCSIGNRFANILA